MVYNVLTYGLRCISLWFTIWTVDSMDSEK